MSVFNFEVHVRPQCVRASDYQLKKAFRFFRFDKDVVDKKILEIIVCVGPVRYGFILIFQIALGSRLTDVDMFLEFLQNAMNHGYEGCKCSDRKELPDKTENTGVFWSFFQTPESNGGLFEFCSSKCSCSTGEIAQIVAGEYASIVNKTEWLENFYLWQMLIEEEKEEKE